MLCFFFFVFQAEDGIRDRDVTGVQTCALPISPVLDQEPVVDAARRRRQGLIVLAREFGAEGPRRRQSASWMTRQTTWPVVTGWPGATDSSETVPPRGAVISFSIFIASTTQTTWPG